jgi:hypothetical protein
MPAILAAVLVLAVGASLIAAEPRPPRSPPPLVLSGNLPAMVTLAPVAWARIRGDR